MHFHYRNLQCKVTTPLSRAANLMANNNITWARLIWCRVANIVHCAV
jgi:hypothetical protein